MTSWNEAEELRRDALGKDADKSDRLNERAREVRRDFWAKLKAVGRHIPFVEDLFAAYYCAFDPATPTRVRACCLRHWPTSFCLSTLSPTCCRSSGSRMMLRSSQRRLLWSPLTSLPSIVPQQHAPSTKNFPRGRDALRPSRHSLDAMNGMGALPTPRSSARQLVGRIAAKPGSKRD